MFRPRLARKPLPVPTVSFRHATIPTRADVVVAQGFWKRRYHFPGAVRLEDGTILVVARHGIEHVDQHGKIRLMRSTDDGRTWSKPKTIVNSKGDDRDPKISVDSRGRVFLLYFTRKDKKTRHDVAEGAYVMHSDDQGLAWSSPTLVETSKHGWVACHGAVTGMQDGSLLAPVYQSGRSVVVRSVDGGRSFPAAHEHVFDTGGIKTNEITLIPHRNGAVTAWLRPATDGAESLVYRSKDSGVTWEGPEMSDIRQSSADGLELRDGRLCLVWGDLSGRFGERRVTCAALVNEPMLPWAPTPPTPVWDAFNYDQGNPAIVQLDEHSVLVFITDYASRQLVSKRVFLTDLERTPHDATQLDGALDLESMVAAGTATLTASAGEDGSDLLDVARDAIRHRLGLPPEHADAKYQSSAHITVTFTEPQTIREVGVALRPGENQDAVVSVRDEEGTWRRVGVLAHAWRYGDLDWLRVREPGSVTGVSVSTRVSDGRRPPKSREPLPATVTQLALR